MDLDAADERRGADLLGVEKGVGSLQFSLCRVELKLATVVQIFIVCAIRGIIPNVLKYQYVRAKNHSKSSGFACACGLPRRIKGAAAPLDRRHGEVFDGNRIGGGQARQRCAEEREGKGNQRFLNPSFRTRA